MLAWSQANPKYATTFQYFRAQNMGNSKKIIDWLNGLLPQQATTQQAVQGMNQGIQPYYGNNQQSVQPYYQGNGQVVQPYFQGNNQQVVQPYFQGNNQVAQPSMFSFSSAPKQGGSMFGTYY
jgi:hypothetical protein